MPDMRSHSPIGNPNLNSVTQKSAKTNANANDDQDYQHINSNIYSAKFNRKKRIEDYPCNCTKGKCSNDNCKNRQLRIECSSDCKIVDCDNQKFRKLEYSDVERYRIGEKGYGLRARKLIYEGQFILEYAGEYITRQEFLKRQREHEKSQLAHHYFLQIGSNYIDASQFGNLSRHINHSCSPNSVCERWMVPGTVGELLRVGFFASRNIKAGEEITFHYSYAALGENPQRCLCGKPNCCGYVGGKFLNEAVVGENDEDLTDGEDLDDMTKPVSRKKQRRGKNSVNEKRGRSNRSEMVSTASERG